LLSVDDAQVHKEDAAAANSRVTIQADAEGLANGCTDSVLEPVAVLSPASIGSLAQAAAATCSSGLKDLGLFLQQQQQQQGWAAYSVDLPLFFSLDREDFALTDAFFRHYKELQRIATREVQQLSHWLYDTLDPQLVAWPVHIAIEYTLSDLCWDTRPNCILCSQSL
jgi:hypothetical protein